VRWSVLDDAGPGWRALQRLVTLYAAVEEMQFERVAEDGGCGSARQNKLSVVEAGCGGNLRGSIGTVRCCQGDGMGLDDSQTASRRPACWAGTTIGTDFAWSERELNDAAMEQYVASRLKREQIKRVFDDIAAADGDVKRGRRRQTASDESLSSAKTLDRHQGKDFGASSDKDFPKCLHH